LLNQEERKKERKIHRRSLIVIVVVLGFEEAIDTQWMILHAPCDQQPRSIHYSNGSSASNSQNGSRNGRCHC
jgi:hypothetical protein